MHARTKGLELVDDGADVALEEAPSGASSGLGQADDSSDASSLNLAYNRIRSAILHAELKPGSVISQVQLAQQVGVSRTPLREALRLLQREGLVDAEHQRRVRIAEMSVADLEQLYALRIAVESLAIRISVPKMSHQDLERLQGLLKAMEVAIASSDVNGYEVPHRQFHATVYRYAGDRICRQIEELSDHAERYRRAFIREEGSYGWKLSFAEHKAIAEQCAAGKPRQAAEAVAKHLARTSLSIIMHDAPEHEPAMIRASVKAVTGAGEQTPG